MAVRIARSAAPISMTELAAFEQRLGHRLPDDYRAFLLKHNGGEPRPAKFRYARRKGEHTTGEIARFLWIRGDRQDHRDVEGQLAGYAAGDLKLPNGLLPIADDSVDDAICIAVTGPDRGKIFLCEVNHEDDAERTGPAGVLRDKFVHLVADSFDAFLASLKGKRKPPWVELIEDGDLAGVRSWLDAGGDLSAKNPDRQTPLQVAAAEGQLEIVRLLIERGAPLAGAAAHPSLAAFACSPLLLAVSGGHTEVTRFFVSRGVAKPELQQALMASVFTKERSLVELLLDAGADVNQQEELGATPLHNAARGGHPEIVSLLLSRGAQPEVTDCRKETPLVWAIRHHAFQRGDVEVAKLLIDAGATLNPAVIAMLDYLPNRTLAEELKAHAASRQSAMKAIT